MEVDGYLDRIGHTGGREPTAATLRQLHRGHMLAVPFDNLDIALGNPIALSLPSLYDKIVRRRRGGFCYELNGLFGWLLEQLGFGVERVSARVFSGGQPGPEFDHLALVVGLEERWLCDVGFGDSFLEPLRLDDAQGVAQGGSWHRVVGQGSERTLERQRPGAEWEPRYVFSLLPHPLEAFSAQCQRTQSDPSSTFTQKVICTRATAEGRVTLSNRRLITTGSGGREELEAASGEEHLALLKTHFGVDLGAGCTAQGAQPADAAAALWAAAGLARRGRV